MKAVRFSSLSILFLLTLLFSGQPYLLANDTNYLIQEMESLRDSLSVDDPARIDLTLRLADLYFDASIKEGNNQLSDSLVVRKQRMKALDLYKHSLSGSEGIAKVKGLDRLKIQFQMARLLSRLGEYESAEEYYLEVEAHSKTPMRMREQASLALAEWYEEDAKFLKSVDYYDKALSLCRVKTSCNYAHYRKAWLYFKDTKLDGAISEMKASLWASDAIIEKGKIIKSGEVRESSLQDLLLFMSNTDSDGDRELKFITSLSKQLNRPELVRKLVEAFYVAGNRRAGSHLLSYINDKTPKLYYEIRLLEEFYGFRKWEKVEKYLNLLKKRTSLDLPSKTSERNEIKKILQRYLVQVDSEAEVISELNSFLVSSIDIYLQIYPNDELRKKLQQGWLKATADELAKIRRLGKWIKEDIALEVRASDVRKLRQTRLSLAQKHKLSKIVIEESLAIAEILKGTSEANEFTYVGAREYYQLKKYDKALVLFNSLVDRSIELQKIDQWSLLSQNLILDIFNGKKEFDRIVMQVELWKKLLASIDTTRYKNKKFKADLIKDTAQMNSIKIEAQFEKAASLTDSPSSLEAFYNFCFQNIYPEKSCSNAKVLSIKFSDQKKLISLLEREHDENSLMNEYEIMGEFTKAAKLHEKLILNKKNKDVSYESFLKVALLYELDEAFSDRNRILHKMITKIKNEKSIPEHLEGGIFLTLDEAGLLNSKSLFLPWSLKRKINLANRLEMIKPNKISQKILLSQEDSQGPLWSKLILEKVEKKFLKVNKTKFYGQNSKWLFKKRTKNIENFVNFVKPKLNGADLETRVYLLHMLTRVYGSMTEDILATPLPSDLDETTMAQVQIQLQSMSEPFEKVRADYQALLDKQISSFDLSISNELELKERVVNNISQIDNDKYSALILVPSASRTKVISDRYEGISQFKLKINVEPNNLTALEGLFEYFDRNEMKRLASYYKVRIESIKMQKKSDSLRI